MKEIVDSYVIMQISIENEYSCKEVALKIVTPFTHNPLGQIQQVIFPWYKIIDILIDKVELFLFLKYIDIYIE